MKNTTTYIRNFGTKNQAIDWMVVKNQTAMDRTNYVVVDGPSDNFAVVDLKTAIELGGSYEWATR